MLIKFLDGTSREIANLHGANLHGANLYGADLYGANLHSANLHGANLRNTNLRNTNLHSANLIGANLYGADLRNADLGSADLGGANLRGAYLRDANLAGCIGLEQQCITPEGVLIGYKKLAGGTIATLRIPAKAKRLNAYGSRKCRAEYAIVIDGAGFDTHSGTVKYITGKRVTPDKFDDDKRIECSHGIHFFITKEEALAY
jgi:Family of unknown function (DUF5758)/Pentapeptide repeats (8 copies)